MAFVLSYFSQTFFIENFKPSGLRLMFRFGLFLGRDTSNVSELGEYSMYTGEGDPYKLATIHSYDGNTEMSFWNDSQCNKVHGSDGASFNPYIKKVCVRLRAAAYDLLIDNFAEGHPLVLQ